MELQPAGGFGLAKDEEEFVREFVKCADPVKAAKALDRPARWGRVLYQRPAVRAAIQAALQEAKQLLAAKAMIIVGEIMDDPRVGARVRLDAAKFMVEQGLGKAVEAPRMTDPEELQARINERLKALGLDAKVINATPKKPKAKPKMALETALRKKYQSATTFERPKCQKSQS